MDGDRMQPQLAERLGGDPVLAEFLSPFPRLAESGHADVGRTFERLGEIVGGSEIRARVHFGVVEDGRGHTMRSWSLEFGPESCSVGTGRVHRPDLEVLVGIETWRRLAEGSVSPLEAFGRGDMRVRGDVRLAGRLVGLLRRR